MTAADLAHDVVSALADDIVWTVDLAEKDRMIAAGWSCIGASTILGGRTVYWLQRAPSTADGVP